jgi:hypothetical protein
VPTVLRIGPFRFHFYANEGDEPAHVHVENGDGECKFWLGDVRLAEVAGVRASDLRKIERLVRENHEHLMRSWDAFQQLRRR